MLDGVTAFVTDASQGIGRVIATELADEGFSVETDPGERYRTEYVVAATKNAGGQAISPRRGIGPLTGQC